MGNAKSSHILDELSKIADTIGIIDHGAMLAEVSMKELTAKGIDLETYYLGHLSMIFDAKWQNFCVRKIPMPMLV